MSVLTQPVHVWSLISSFGAAVTIAVAVGEGTPPGRRSPEINAQPSCSLTVRDANPLVLRDGRTAYVAAQSAAVSRGAILGVATPAHTFRDGFVVLSDTVVGFVLDTSGNAIPVLNPLFGRVASDLRVAAAEGGGWHLLFLDKFGQHTLGPADSAAVWYGRFDGGQWRDLSRIAVIYHGRLDHDFSPDLGVDGERIRFAFPFDKPIALGESPRGKQGLIMLRRDAGRWTADTLDLPEAPLYVSLTRVPTDTTWRVGFVSVYYEARRFREQSLFIADYDITWRPPVLVENDSLPVHRPSLVGVRGAVIAAWLRGDGAVNWMPVTLTPPPTQARPSGPLFPASEDYHTLALDPATLLWYTRVGPRRGVLGAGAADNLRARLYRQGRVIDVAPVDVPNDAFLGRAVAVSPTDVVMFTTGAPRGDARLTLRTIVVRLRVACSSR